MNFYKHIFNQHKNHIDRIVSIEIQDYSGKIRNGSKQSIDTKIFQDAKIFLIFFVNSQKEKIISTNKVLIKKKKNCRVPLNLAISIFSVEDAITIFAIAFCDRWLGLII